jgi:hypothetical protein
LKTLKRTLGFLIGAAFVFAGSDFAFTEPPTEGSGAFATLGWVLLGIGALALIQSFRGKV